MRNKYLRKMLLQGSFLGALLFTIIFSCAFTAAYSGSGQISLLTVSESANSTQERGGVADLYLTIKPGTGRIFIDSFPLTKVDTQITTRFATELACDFLDMDCSGLDFFYTIRARSAIVGGPSAGAAATVLTVALLDEKKLDPGTIMTGTINSGNLIGPVSGISAKTLAAQEQGFNKALIPKWGLENDTPGEDLDIEIIYVSTLEDALYQFTGTNYSKDDHEIMMSGQYTQLMSDVAAELCTKYGSIKEDNSLMMPNLTNVLENYFPSSETGNEDTAAGINSSLNSTFNISLLRPPTRREYFVLAEDAIRRQEYYSAASFCFGGNVRIANAYLSNMTSKELALEYARLLGDIYLLEKQINERNISTISDLETHMIVTERILDSKNALERNNPENISTSQLAYALERFETARIWSKFFGIDGPGYVLDKEQLKRVCTSKISEAEERINYMEMFLPKSADRDDLRQAYAYYDDGQYPLCIFTASKAKADVDVVLGVLYVSEPNLMPYFDEKMIAVKKAIAKQERHGIFPILGYSYYEYALSLSRTDLYSALIYAENALEMSSLDMYFPKENEGKGALPKEKPLPSIDWVHFMLGFSVGILFSILFGSIFIWIMKRKAKNPGIKTKKKK
jgi:uncharacterized protein